MKRMPFYVLGTGLGNGNFLFEIIIYSGKENTGTICVMFELLSLVTYLGGFKKPGSLEYYLSLL